MIGCLYVGNTQTLEQRIKMKACHYMMECKNIWVEEEIDMTEFLGDSIQLRFQLVSDNFVTGDGFTLMILNYISMAVWILSSTMYPM